MRSLVYCRANARLEARVFQQMVGKTTMGNNALEQVILKDIITSDADMIPD